MMTQKSSTTGRSLKICLTLLALVVALNAVAVESALARHNEGSPISIVATDRFGIDATTVPDQFRCRYEAAPVHDYRCSDNGTFSQTLAERGDSPGLLVANEDIPDGKTVRIRELRSFWCSFTGGPDRVPGAYSCNYWDNASQRRGSFNLGDAVYVQTDLDANPQYVYVEPCYLPGCPPQ